MSMEGRICTRCNQYKSSNYFGKSELYQGGLRSHCNNCRKLDRLDNLEKIKKSNKIYYQNNKTKINKQKQEHHLERYNNDPLYNLQIKLRRRIWVSLKKRRLLKKNSQTTIKLLGCTYQQFKEYIEKKFTENMTWDKVLNGEIHIDHIIPVSSFNLFEEKQLKDCFYYTNLQPLWAKDNLIKATKLILLKVRG